MKGSGGGGVAAVLVISMTIMIMICCSSTVVAAQSIKESSTSTMQVVQQEYQPNLDGVGTTDIDLHCVYEIGHGLVVCIKDITWSIFHGKLELDHSCCDAMANAEFKCLDKTWPFTHFSVGGYRLFCYRTFGIKSPPLPELHYSNEQQHYKSINAYPPSSSSAEETSTDLIVRKEEINQCFSTISSIQGCVEGIIESFSKGRIGTEVGHDCCKAAIEISDNCWSKIFPFIPFFSSLLKNYCASFIEIAATAPIPGGLI